MPDFLADWREYWAGVDADIRMALGVEPVEINEQHVMMRMPFRREISQATGVFSAGALIQLADIAATWLSLVRLRASGAPEGSFPFAVQLSTNLVANIDHGDARAEATITSAGRSLIVTHTRVTDDDDRPLLLQTGTHLIRIPRAH